MSEQTPTPEQIAAVEWLRAVTERAYGDDFGHARTILDSLDPALTNPQPALPNEAGHYLAASDSVITLDDEGDWTWNDGGLVVNPIGLMPLRRLVPERPPITREQVEVAYAASSTRHGRVDAILALMNGTDR